MNVSALLSDRAVQMGDAVAIIEGAQSAAVTFRQLDAQTSSVAEQLRTGGVRPGDSVLVLVPMCSTLYAVLAAILRIGAVAMFPDPSAGATEVDRACGVNPPAAFIGTPRAHVLRLLSRNLRRVPLAFSTGPLVPGARRLRGRVASAAAATSCVECGDDAPALITFTSGSTGLPKAALRSHGFLLAQQRALAGTLQLTAGDVDLATLPIFVLANLAAGVTTIIPQGNLRQPGTIDPRPILAQIERFRPNRASGSPAFFERLAAGTLHEELRLDSFAQVFTGGAPVFPGLLDRIARIAPAARVVGVYGSTEAEPIAHIDRAAITRADRDAMIRGRGLLAGEVSAFVRLAILPDRWGHPLQPMTATAFEASALPPEGVGEIVVTGDHVLKHYLRGAGEEETKFRVDGQVWHRTGDAGRLDRDGRLWLLGRCAARISDARGEFYPFSVECAAVETLGVRRAAALAWRGRRTLVLEPGENAPRPDIARLSAALDGIELDEVRLLRRIPVDRRHNAKVDYRELERLLDARHPTRTPRDATRSPTRSK